jgi:hypothetical protein
MLAKRLSWQTFILIVALQISILIFALASAVVTVVVPRYLAPVNICSWLSLGIALCALLNGRQIVQPLAKVPTHE